MNLLTIIYGLLFGTLLIGTAFVLFTRIVVNFHRGQRVRARLAEKIASLRLGQMLEKRQINTNRYLAKTAFHSVMTQISRCEQCQQTARCDRYLNQSNNSAIDVAFCPNNPDLSKS